VKPLQALWAPLLAVTLGIAWLHAQDVKRPLQATNLDLNVERVQVLERELAQAHADIVGLKADKATCDATLQSAVLTTEVLRAVDEMKAKVGGNWTWDNNLRRIVPVKEEQK
jgi:hypothetical protein